MAILLQGVGCSQNNDTASKPALSENGPSLSKNGLRDDINTILKAGMTLEESLAALQAKEHDIVTQSGTLHTQMYFVKTDRFLGKLVVLIVSTDPVHHQDHLRSWKLVNDAKTPEKEVP
jgi:hypothetical protein